MNKKLVQVIEGTISLAIVASLYLVGVYVKPKEKIIHLDHPSVELRDRFLGVAAPVDKTRHALDGRQGRQDPAQ